MISEEQMDRAHVAAESESCVTIDLHEAGAEPSQSYTVEPSESFHKRKKSVGKRAKAVGKRELSDWRVLWTATQWFPSGEKPVEKQLDEDGLFKNTVELQENPLTALFLCVASDIWPRFPASMKVVFVGSALGASLLQWICSIVLWRYLVTQKEGMDIQHKFMRMVGTWLASAILFLYLMGAVRVAFATWQIALPRLRRKPLGWFCAGGLFSDILLHFFVAFVCVMAIGTQENISDKLQVSLAFFFICEVDEWMYSLCIQPFDVLDSEDFVIEEEKSEEEKQRLLAGQSRVDIIWDMRARQAIRWVLILIILIAWAVAYSLTF